MSNTFDDYQQQAKKTAVYPDKYGKSYAMLGLVNEAGEVAGKYKKYLRGDYDAMHVRDWKTMMRDELGDVLWYLAAVASEFDLSLDDIAQANLDKLQSRHERGVIKGDGDDR
jgi:NTP pyrophosphatase (non-canonical NTP hydrolase)